MQWSARNRSSLSFEHMKLIEKGYKFLAKGNNLKGRFFMLYVKVIYLTKALLYYFCFCE